MTNKPTDGMDWLDYEAWREREKERQKLLAKNQKYIHKFGGRT